MKRAFTTLYGRSSNGQIKVWKITAESRGEYSEIITEYGKDDGEMLWTALKVATGKNIGRSNETTHFEQACLEALSKWSKKKDKNYVEKREYLGREPNLLPMLAHSYTKRAHDIEWPAFVQPKLNGIRCLARKTSQSEISYLSRGGKDFGSLGHLTPHLLKVMDVGEILDGELFTTQLTFQEIVAAVKREKTVNPNTEKIEYWIYDCVQTKATFSERNRHLLGILPGKGPLVTVPTLEAKNENAMMKLHTQFVQAGYEGIIIRNKQGLYCLEHRSKHLQKYKDFIDEEFEIVGGKQGTGRDTGTIIWRCKTEEEKYFDARPRGSHEQRKAWWDNLPKIVGKKLTVRYQNRSDDGIPIFPVGIAVRDYE